MRLSNLLTTSYWFSQPDPALNTVKVIWFAVFFGLIAAGLVALFLRQRTEDGALKLAFGRGANLVLTMGLTGLLFFFFRQENVAFLGWRFWFFAWFVGVLWWGAVYGRYLVKRLPVIRAEQKERELRERYSPNRRR